MPEQQNQKHVMLSYQWNAQKLVLSVYDYLAERQVPMWMDIKAGIPSSNVFEGIAEAIENSAYFVCFMTPEYQQSEYCKQELQYAKQRKIPIIPLKLEEEWEPSGWLGFITAGLLWLDFYHIKNLEQKTAILYNRIRTIVGEEVLLKIPCKSKPKEKERVFRPSTPIPPRAYTTTGRIEKVDQMNIAAPRVSLNRQQSPRKGKHSIIAHHRQSKVSSIDSDEEEKNASKCAH